MRLLLNRTVLAGLALASLLGAPSLDAGPDPLPSPERMPMVFNQPQANPRGGRPPLDASRPPRIETATFALG
jgi:hypothetical protein